MSRAKTLGVRLSEEEYAALAAKAEADHRTLADWARLVLLGKIPVRVESEDRNK